MLYLLQLAQALKLGLKSESFASDARSSRSVTSAVSYDDSGLADLVARAVNNHVGIGLLVPDRRGRFGGSPDGQDVRQSHLPILKAIERGTTSILQFG